MTNLEHSDILSEKKYYEFVLNQYEPSPYESRTLKDDKFYDGVYYSHICKTRCFLVYREIAKLLLKDINILDLGLFPGTIIRQLKILMGDKVRCYGAGNLVDENFSKFMMPHMESCVEAEFDPFYCKTQKRIKIPYEDETFDVIIATEILEHLISPLEMISEGARLLKKNGIFIVTSPNVSHIGAVIKLLSGRSNHERIERSPMSLQKDKWRGHIRFYDKNEIKNIFSIYGLKLFYHKYYRELGWSHAKWPLAKRIVISIIDKISPIHREGHFAVLKKQ